MSTNGRIAIIFNSINVTGLLTTLEEAYIYRRSLFPFSVVSPVRGARPGGGGRI